MREKIDQEERIEDCAGSGSSDVPSVSVSSSDNEEGGEQGGGDSSQSGSSTVEMAGTHGTGGRPRW